MPIFLRTDLMILITFQELTGGSNTHDTGFVSHMDFINVQSQKLALLSLTSGGRSVGIVCSWLQAMEFSF
jgi:hypothetical protein